MPLNQTFRPISADFPQAGYNYQQKYLLDFNGAYNGSDRFQAKKRNGFFPAVGVGWNISQESFFKERNLPFSLLKLRGSYGVVGSDVTRVTVISIVRSITIAGVILLEKMIRSRVLFMKENWVIWT
ncbi:TonB-dependent receptor [Chitinophaga pinensis]|nr:TonB-dependent receptor [Chitinophaga pinensis]